MPGGSCSRSAPCRTRQSLCTCGSTASDGDMQEVRCAFKGAYKLLNLVGEIVETL